jgi:cytochrome c
MCLLERLALGAALLAAVPAASVTTLTTALAADEPHFGKPVTAQDLAAWDISIGPDGAGLPPGKGSVAQGEAVYAAKCQACHAEKGAGGPNDRLVGGAGTIAPDKAPVKTVGSYWPYATTLFDYVRRAMPWDRPKSLTDDEVYAVAAYVLYLNGVIGQDAVLDAQSLPKVKMPNREGFTAFPRWPPK